MPENIQNLNVDEFVNLFPEASSTNPDPQKKFFGMEDTSANLFDSTTTSTTQTTEDQSTTETTTLVEEDQDSADILGEQEKDKSGPGRPPKYIKDAADYFADRIKAGKFVAVQEEIDGKTVDFLPKTPEEFDEVLDMQVNYMLQQKSKELEQNWYQGKSPAWQAVAQYAEMVDSPEEILPFLRSVSNIESVSKVDENTVEGAERIIRARLEQRGDTEDVIEMNIESLKTTDKLIETAKKYKPIIVQQEKQQLAAMKQQQELEQQEYYKTVTEIEESARKAIDSPIFGKNKLKQEEKAIIYDLIAVPDEKTGGYPIFTQIDNLYEKRDFETLRQVALLLAKREAFVGYISTGAADKTAGNLQRKLTLAGESRTHGGNDQEEVQRVTVPRNQYGTSNPRFGR